MVLNEACLGDAGSRREWRIRGLKVAAKIKSSHFLLIYLLHKQYISFFDVFAVGVCTYSTSKTFYGVFM